MLRTLINVGELGAGEVRHPERRDLPARRRHPLQAPLLEGRATSAALDDPDLHPTERELLERLGRRRSLAVPIMFGDGAWGEL